MIRRIYSEYKKVLDTLKKEVWTDIYKLMAICLGAFVGSCIICFCVLLCYFHDKKDIELIIFAFLACIIIIAITIAVGIKMCMPFLMKKAENDKVRENRVLSMIQEEYEQENLAEKTRIGIVEKHAKAIIEEMVRDTEFRRQIESKQQDYNTIIAEITSELYKASCSAQNPQTLSDQQIVSQLINLLTNNNR